MAFPLPVTVAHGGITSKRLSWWRDFAWDDGCLLIRKTAIRLKPDLALLHEIYNWAIYLALLQGVAAWARIKRRQRRRIWFAPDCPRPWYLIRGSAMWTGMELAAAPDAADACVYFDDSTTGHAPAGMSGASINVRCVDITKSRVANVFEDVFGYPLRVDPRQTTGEIVEKPETNGVHGGRIVMAPVEPRPGYTYQRLVDTRDGDGRCRDLRTPCAAGQPILVWVKIKPPDSRFSINNQRAFLMEPQDVYSEHERALIQTFATRIGLDWGGLDILRDRDGRIYIVDVNKTDLGPVIALSWRDKLLSMARLGAAFDLLVLRFASPRE